MNCSKVYSKVDFGSRLRVVFMVDYSPSPDVRYQMHLEYLAELCKLMSRRYNEEYVDGCRTLQQDAEEYQDASMEGEM